MCTALEKLKDEGRLEGRQEGRKEGRQEGRLEGRQEGRQEERWNSVLKLLRKGFSALEVADLLELTEKEVLEIQQKA